MKKFIFVLFVILTVAVQLTAVTLNDLKGKWDYSSFNSDINIGRTDEIEYFSKLCKESNGTKKFIVETEKKNLSFKEYKDICLRVAIYNKNIDRKIANIIWITQ
jgi:hypothetical protein